MTEHRGNSFYNSCVKVPVDPYSRQPTPSYERLRLIKSNKDDNIDIKCKINFTKDDQFFNEYEISNSKEIFDNFLEFLESIPDYGQVYHLSNEQFKQKVDYLRRKQKLLLENLQNTSTDHENINISNLSISKCNEIKPKIKSKDNINDLTLNGKKCSLEEFRVSSPILFTSDKFNGLTKDQDLLINSKGKNSREINSASKSWRTLSRLNSSDSIESDIDSIETQSLPASATKEWHPTVPKPFSFTLREEAEKYMTRVEMGKEMEHRNLENNKKNIHRKRRIRSIPLTSKIPLYNKLLAEKEERSRIVREESAFNLMSQVRPFKLECDRRAWRSLARSSPDIRNRIVNTNIKFKAKPVPKNLFSTEIYDRMLEDEYYRQLQKKIRAAQLMKSSSLPPSMARRERVKSAYKRSQNTMKNYEENTSNRNTSRPSSNTSVPLKGYRSMMSLLPLRGNNLAAILRCQVSRYYKTIEKLEREIRERMEEKRREHEMKIRESLIGRNPVWRALRSAARHEHERDLNIRTSLRRDEAREQAERHRLQMEMMIDRVTQIPTLFERHSQSYQSLMKAQQESSSKMSQRNKKEKQQKHISNSADSYVDCGNASRPDSGSLTSYSGTLLSTSQSSKSSNTNTSISENSTAKSQVLFSKRKGDRGQLKVSINETAELIEDQDKNGELHNNQHSFSGKCDGNTFRNDEYDKER
ncbi:uncharacterized protein LOC100883008 isoform X2 [Megachile rotundata]|uniref:uncharacterized protein LOC100883008 isoform X2 n=1 Tax=Megachile rotundata TaxID=143995 RepID=UPI003FCF97E7